MVETVEQAELMVKAVRYPPEGIRGVRLWHVQPVGTVGRIIPNSP